MKELQEIILQQGKVIADGVLKVARFLNHQVDPILMEQMGKAIAQRFQNKGITKVVTVESSGIAPALMTALNLQVPMVFIKKAQPSTMLNPLFVTVTSYTKNKEVTLCVESEFLTHEDKVLFIDDFLANGQVFVGIQQLLKQSGATLSGVAIVIEKYFQQGRILVEESGVEYYPLCRIASLSNGKIEFMDTNETDCSL